MSYSNGWFADYKIRAGQLMLSKFQNLDLSRLWRFDFCSRFQVEDLKTSFETTCDLGTHYAACWLDEMEGTETHFHFLLVNKQSSDDWDFDKIDKLESMESAFKNFQGLLAGKKIATDVKARFRISNTDIPKEGFIDTVRGIEANTEDHQFILNGANFLFNFEYFRMLNWMAGKDVTDVSIRGRSDFELIDQVFYEAVEKSYECLNRFVLETTEKSI